MIIRRTSKQGFTIVEIMVIIVIMGIVTLVGSRSYLNQVRETELKKDVMQIIDDLDRTRQKAISRDTEGVASCDVVSYSLGFNIGNSNYVMTRRCQDGTYNQVWSTLKSSLVQSATPFEVYFTYPYGTPNTTQTVVITHKSFARCVTITVNNVGAISSTDPVTCL